jgi:hypothetical protein
MRDRVFFLGIAIVGALALSPSVGFSQAQTAPTRIPQQIVINGQMASGAYVTGSAGQLQSFTCPAPAAILDCRWQFTRMGMLRTDNGRLAVERRGAFAGSPGRAGCAAGSGSRSSG